MERRAGLSVPAAIVATSVPSPSGAQAARVRRVAVLAPSTAAREEVTLKPFFDEMRELGWIEGRTVEYERAYADDRVAQLPGTRPAQLVRIHASISARSLRRCASST